MTSIRTIGLLVASILALLALACGGRTAPGEAADPSPPPPNPKAPYRLVYFGASW